MSLLTLDSDRVVRDAVDAFLEGTLRPDPLPDTLYATKNSRYRIVAGLVHEASDTSLMGAELVGWLAEDEGVSRIEPRWEFRARAIFVERATKEVVVTSRVIAKSLVTERAPAAAQKGTIPPAPPIPVLKQSPSVAPPALVSLGPDIVRGPRPPMGSEEEITKVEEFTAVATQDQLMQLRLTSESGELPAASASFAPREDADAHTTPTTRPPPPSGSGAPPSSRRGAPPSSRGDAPPPSGQRPAPPPSSRRAAPSVPRPASSRPPAGDARPASSRPPPPPRIPRHIDIFDSTDEDVEELSGPDIEVHEPAPLTSRLGPAPSGIAPPPPAVAELGGNPPAIPPPSRPPRALPPMNPPPRKPGR